MNRCKEEERVPWRHLFVCDPHLPNKVGLDRNLCFLRGLGERHFRCEEPRAASASPSSCHGRMGFGGLERRLQRTGLPCTRWWLRRECNVAHPAQPQQLDGALQ
jgi:hypothetical protein